MAELNTDNKTMSKNTHREEMASEEEERTDETDETSSDLSLSSRRSSDGYQPTNHLTSNSSSESDIVFSSDDDSSEDVEERIHYINQKQRILKRAACVLFDHEEEMYNATTAKATSTMLDCRPLPGSIWTQAARIAPPNNGTQKRPTFRKRLAGNKKDLEPNPRDPTINLGEVFQVDSGVFDRTDTTSDYDEDSTDGLPEVTFALGQWMAQALIRSSSTFFLDGKHGSMQCRWRVVSDPLTCSLGLVPPPSVSMEHTVSIEDALKFSDEAHLLTQATPPFCVVFVNKAFMVLAGLNSKDALIGKPVESFLQVTQDIMSIPKSDSDDDFIRAQFLRHLVVPALPENGNRDENVVFCRMRIAPVMDHSRRCRLSTNARKARRFSCMSHVLIRIHESRVAISPASSSANVQCDDQFSVSDSEALKDEDTSCSIDDAVRADLVGTVG